MRMFVAAVPPAEAVADLEAFLEPRRSAAAFRWTDPEQIHLTLAFAADVPDRALDELVERLDAAAARRTPVAMWIAGGGAFPHVDAAKVLWTGLEIDTPQGAAEVEALARGARAAVAVSGAPVDGTRFRPHLTLARSGRPVGMSDWVRLLETYAGPRWRLDEIALMASYLGQGRRRRPRYEVVHTAAVGG